jgi:glycosyltransferase involved in cell wall biosynthesis
VRRVKLLVFAHTPPPHHGQSYMVQLLLDGLRPRKTIECFHVNSRFSDDLTDIGRVRAGKIALVLKYCYQAIVLRFRHGVRAMYYIPASPGRAALFRDWLIMALCRPFFSQIIFHWEAAGLAEWLATRTAIERFLSQRLLGRPALSIVLAEYNRRDAEYFRSKRVAIVPNGVPDPHPSAGPQERTLTPPQTFKVLFLGLCTREKGIWDAIEGVVLANRQDHTSRFQLLVAGGFWVDEERLAFEKRAGELQAPDGDSPVEYRGFVSGRAKQALFDESHCLLFPTYYSAESFGIVLVEAMAHGLPVITTRWRMIPELLPREYPFLVSPKAPAEIADALLRLRAQPGKWNLRQHYLNNFTDRHYLDKMEAALLSI